MKKVGIAFLSVLLLVGIASAVWAQGEGSKVS